MNREDGYVSGAGRTLLGKGHAPRLTNVLRAQVRNVTLLPVVHAITAARALGRGPRTIAFMQALNSPLPPLWEALAEQEGASFLLRHPPLYSFS